MAFRQWRRRKWAAAGKMARAAAASLDVTPRDRCEALTIDASSEFALDKLDGVRAAERDYERFCSRGEIPAQFWTQLEMRNLKGALAPGTPAWDIARAKLLNRSRDWNGVRAAAARVLASAQANEEQHCEALLFSTEADLSLGKKEEARRTLERFPPECRALPREHILRIGYDQVKEDLGKAR